MNLLQIPSLLLGPDFFYHVSGVETVLWEC